MKTIIKKIKKLKKPSKKYIRQELINEIESAIQESKTNLLEKIEDLHSFSVGDCKIAISDFKGKDWYVQVNIPQGKDRFGHNYTLFIDKESGKNCYPKKEAK